MEKFSIGEAFKYGWDKFRENTEFSLLITLFVLAVSALGGDSKEMNLLHLAAAILLIIVRIGYTKIFLRMADGEKPKFKDVFAEYELFWKYLGLTILTVVLVVVGLVLFIVPGVIFAIRYSMSTFILIDTKMDILGAMKESSKITKGNKLNLLLFFAVALFVNFIGLLAFVVGIIFTIPVTMFATIYVYRFLSKANASLSTTMAHTDLVTTS